VLETLFSNHFKCQHPFESKAYTSPLRPFTAAQHSSHRWQRPGKFEIIRKFRAVSEGNGEAETIAILVSFPLPRCIVRNNFKWTVEEWVCLTFWHRIGNPFKRRVYFNTTFTFLNRPV